MASRTYPQFPAGMETRFAAVRMAAGKGSQEETLAWLNDPDFPYTGALKEAVRAFVLFDGAAAALGDGGVGGEGNLAVPPLFQPDVSEEEAADGVLEEIQRTIDALRNVERSLEATDVEGKISIIKTKTALLQKWSELKDKVLNMRNVAEFQRLVIEVLDQKLSKEDVQDFKVRLGEIFK